MDHQYLGLTQYSDCQALKSLAPSIWTIRLLDSCLKLRTSRHSRNLRFVKLRANKLSILTRFLQMPHHEALWSLPSRLRSGSGNIYKISGCKMDLLIVNLSTQVLQNTSRLLSVQEVCKYQTRQLLYSLIWVLRFGARKQKWDNLALLEKSILLPAERYLIYLKLPRAPYNINHGWPLTPMFHSRRTSLYDHCKDTPRRRPCQVWTLCSPAATCRVVGCSRRLSTSRRRCRTSW